MITEITLIMLWLTIIWLFFMIFYLLKILKDIAKLIKADNLQEYTIGQEIEKERIEVGQQDERYTDIWNISEKDLKNINIDPNQIYAWNYWKEDKVETFN